MGRIFLSQRLGVRATAERWRRVGRGLRDRDRAALDRLAGMAMAHASEAFFASDDPLESAVLAALLELAKGAESRVEPARATGFFPAGQGPPAPP